MDIKNILSSEMFFFCYSNNFIILYFGNSWWYVVSGRKMRSYNNNYIIIEWNNFKNINLWRKTICIKYFKYPNFAKIFKLNIWNLKAKCQFYKKMLPKRKIYTCKKIQITLKLINFLNFSRTCVKKSLQHFSNLLRHFREFYPTFNHKPLEK